MGLQAAASHEFISQICRNIVNPRPQLIPRTTYPLYQRVTSIKIVRILTIHLFIHTTIFELEEMNRWPDCLAVGCVLHMHVRITTYSEEMCQPVHLLCPSIGVICRNQTKYLRYRSMNEEAHKSDH